MKRQERAYRVAVSIDVYAPSALAAARAAARTLRSYSLAFPYTVTDLNTGKAIRRDLLGLARPDWPEMKRKKR